MSDKRRPTISELEERMERGEDLKILPNGDVVDRARDEATGYRPQVVFYHGNCNDGFCAAWLHWREDRRRQAEEYIPVQYNDDVPALDVYEGKDVYILDFSWPVEFLREIDAAANSLMIVDHHKTGRHLLDYQQESPSCLVIFEEGKSAARLLHQELSGMGPGHNWLVDYTEDRDLWKWELSESKAVTAALNMYPRKFGAWQNLNRAGLAALLVEGRPIMRYRDSVVASATALDKVAFTEIAGYEVPVVNCADPFLISEIVGQLARAFDEYPFAAGFFVKPNMQVVYSLRRRDGDVDVSDVAKRLGGGGHPKAAGFTRPGILPMWPVVFDK